MNKGWAKDRKGFNEAMWAFGHFSCKRHDDAFCTCILRSSAARKVRTSSTSPSMQESRSTRSSGRGGPDQYAFRLGYTPEMMALTYSMFDVLLAPSHGEGFRVPLIEAQACGTPVIATTSPRSVS